MIDEGLKEYHTENGYYMTPTEFADLKQSVGADLSDPNAVNGIEYEAFPAGCDNEATICNGYSLTTN